MDRAVPVAARVTRRRVLQIGGVAFAAVAIGELPALAGASTVTLRRSTFTPLVGDAFTLDGTSVRLAAVDDYGAGRAHAAAGSQAAFVLIFHADAGVPRLQQRTMAVRHRRLGLVRLLVSPAGTGRRRTPIPEARSCRRRA